MLEDLFESGSTSGRFRTVSSSSVSFAVPNLSACDIFPEIAGVTSASDSETDFGEYLMRGQDRLHVGDFVFSPPRPKLRQNSAKQSQDSDDASIKEMLDTLCYTVQDLTHLNGVVDNVVLDWRSGAALEDRLTNNEVVVKTEQSSCDIVDGNADNSLINGYTSPASEGRVHQINQSNGFIRYSSTDAGLQHRIMSSVS